MLNKFLYQSVPVHFDQLFQSKLTVLSNLQWLTQNFEEKITDF